MEHISFIPNNTHPLGGSVMMARGLTRSESTMTRRWDPSKEATAMLSFIESVQKTVRPRWSMAIPSGLPKSAHRSQVRRVFFGLMKTAENEGGPVQ